MDRHTEDIQHIRESFYPYANPYENITELTLEEQRAVTYEIFHNRWKGKIAESTKADTYVLFKPDMKFETYLYHNNRKERVMMTKLRISDHKLMVEVGRHNRPLTPRQDRKCHMCRETVEDEIHFLTDCHLYGNRQQHWDTIYNKVPQILQHSNTDRFIYIMTQEDPELTEIILKMVYQWMTLRKFLYDNFYSLN